MPSSDGTWSRSLTLSAEPVTAPAAAERGSQAVLAAPDANLEAVVSLRDVSAGYGERVALDGVTLEIPRGSLTAVVGPNGGGKSTLLKVIAGLLEPWSGSVDVLGAPPGVHASDVA